MTERGRHQLARDAATLAIGPSTLAWDGTALTIDVAERAAPFPRRVTGRVRIVPNALGCESFALDPAGRHVWQPVAPAARIEVAMSAPALGWTGTAYVDANHGNEPLEAGFAHWNWSRAHLPGGRTAILYEGTRADRSGFGLALDIDRDGHARDMPAPPGQRLPATPLWHMPRATRADTGHVARVTRTWEDSPFYSRSALSTHLCGHPAAAVHESLSLARFARPVVQAMLPWRMPRVLG